MKLAFLLVAVLISCPLLGQDMPICDATQFCGNLSGVNSSDQYVNESIGKLWDLSQMILETKCEPKASIGACDYFRYRSTKSLFPNGLQLMAPRGYNILHATFSGLVLEQCIVKLKSGWFSETKIRNKKDLRVLFLEDPKEEKKLRQMVAFSNVGGIARVTIFGVWFPEGAAGGIGELSYRVLKLSNQGKLMEVETSGSFSLFNSGTPLLQFNGNSQSLEATYHGFLENDVDELKKLKIQFEFGPDKTTVSGPNVVD